MIQDQTTHRLESDKQGTIHESYAENQLTHLESRLS